MNREKRLSKLSPNSRNRYKRNYRTLLQLAPGLKSLIHNRSRAEELIRITQKMNSVISGTRSDDAIRMKSQIGHYAAPNPSVSAISPPINNGSSSRSHLGVNHPVLASFLCPIMSLKEYNTDPVEYISFSS
ncbi:hypothetical protein K503DRAFT_785173 [Rhizopogon vinicolor AM-OR11-026]|uniref:Uncharacterized protein n=1 Tax=Rhizopogon vinicolor AM-OR11-026 TaxID=1314800 RepID=A0A1B7MRT0_9AGAM|nr:hypothetical protein K503DRAFT_785173 [Rhizopogon vinicolor AM-OR11-026]